MSLNIKTQNRTYLLLLLCSFIIIATNCKKNNPNSEVIEIDLDAYKKSDIKTQLKSVIKLETNEESLIGNIDKIEYFKEKIYVLDKSYSKTLFVFGINGKYITKTKLGRGPGEVIQPWTFIIDKKKSKVMLWDQALSSIINYDLDLNYLSTEKHNVLIRDFTKLGEDTFLIMSYKLQKEISSKKNLTTYSLYTKNFTTALGHFLPVGLDEETQTTRNPMCYFEETLFIKPWDYNIYTLMRSDVKTRYEWDLGKYMFSDSDKDINNDSKWEKVRNGNRVGPFFNLSASKSYITLAVYFKNGVRTLLYSKKSNKAIQLNSFFQDESLPECLIGNVIENEDDSFFGIVTDKKFGGVSVNDNPVLIKFEISE